MTLYLLYCLLVIPQTFSQPFDFNGIELVIARYNEDLAWLKNSPYDGYIHSIYNKGPTSIPGVSADEVVINLPNLGRESHTYLYHIITRYDSLSELTVFLPGSAEVHSVKNKILSHLFSTIALTPLTNFPSSKYDEGILAKFDSFSLDQWMSRDTGNNAINPERALVPCLIRPFGAWFRSNFPNLPVIKPVAWMGIFAVAREHIRQHPREYYEKLLTYVESSSNPECGHYFERAWGAVFYPYPYSASDSQCPPLGHGL
jgi:Protein of unknown function (DUF3431)